MDDAFAPPVAFAFVICPALNVVTLIIKGANAWVVATDAAVLGNRATTATATAADKKHG
jgi:hypothetical protein